MLWIILVMFYDRDMEIIDCFSIYVVYILVYYNIKGLYCEIMECLIVIVRFVYKYKKCIF